MAVPKSPASCRCSARTPGRAPLGLKIVHLTLRLTNAFAVPQGTHVWHLKATPYTLMSPDDGQQDPIVLTAWGVQRTVTGAKDPNVGKFFETYVQGKQTPEPGAACTGGMSE